MDQFSLISGRDQFTLSFNKGIVSGAGVSQTSTSLDRPDRSFSSGLPPSELGDPPFLTAEYSFVIGFKLLIPERLIFVIDAGDRINATPHGVPN